MTDIQTEIAAPHEGADIIENVPFSIGTALREARLHLGLTVDEVSNRIKFAPRQIESLEADDFTRLPEGAFLRGFIRSYARLLQLDPAPLLAGLKRGPEQFIPAETKVLTEIPYPDIYSERRQNIIWLAGAFLVVVALAIAAWMFADKPKDQSSSANTSAPETHAATKVEALALPDARPISTVPETELAAVSSGVAKSEGEIKKPIEAKIPPQVVAGISKPVAVVKPGEINTAPQQPAIRLTFDANSWVEVMDKNGKLLLSQLNRAGAIQDIGGTPPFSLVIGHARAVHLFYKGQSVDLTPYTKIEVARLTLE